MQLPSPAQSLLRSLSVAIDTQPECMQRTSVTPLLSVTIITESSSESNMWLMRFVISGAKV